MSLQKNTEHKGEKLIFEDLTHIFSDQDKLKYVGVFLYMY